MKLKMFYLAAGALLTVAALMSSQATAASQSTAFTYQGQLNAGGTLPSGQNYQFTFTLYDAVTGGNAVGSAIQQQILVGNGGLFTTDLDFGQLFNGQQYWLEIKVGSTVGNEQPLAARQPVSAVPVAQYALNAPTRMVFLSSASQAIVTTGLNGPDGTFAVLPLSGSVSSAYETTLAAGGFLDLTPNGSTPPPQVFPVNGQLGSISAQAFVIAPSSLEGTTVIIRAQLYVGTVGSSILFPVPALTCQLAPALTGVVFPGTSASCQITGAAVPVSAGSTAMIVVSAILSGPPVATQIPIAISVGVGP